MQLVHLRLPGGQWGFAALLLQVGCTCRQVPARCRLSWQVCAPSPARALQATQLGRKGLGTCYCGVVTRVLSVPTRTAEQAVSSKGVRESSGDGSGVQPGSEGEEGLEVDGMG